MRKLKNGDKRRNIFKGDETSQKFKKKTVGTRKAFLNSKKA
jgi:hypothetical protein